MTDECPNVGQRQNVVKYDRRTQTEPAGEADGFRYRYGRKIRTIALQMRNLGEKNPFILRGLYRISGGLALVQFRTAKSREITQELPLGVDNSAALVTPSDRDQFDVCARFQLSSQALDHARHAADPVSVPVICTK